MLSILSSSSNNFPDVENADQDGLLAIGSNLRTETLLKAYSKGIFPWYNESEPICWYCPDPRFVLFPEKIKISKSMKQIINKKQFVFHFDKNFSGVIKNCRIAKRKGEPGTWISDEIEIAYTTLFKNGFAHSAEAWKDNLLVGGLYGVCIGKVFFGESMFANEANASKFAFIKCVELLKAKGIELIDCQVYTAHLQTLGAELIPRKIFTGYLKMLIG